MKGIKVCSFLLIAVAAVIASYQYKLSVSGTYPTRTFSVDGTGDVDATPNVATFSVTVTTENGKDVTAVQQANTEKMNKVTEFLKNQGVDKKDLKTDQYNLAPRYSYVQCFAAANCPAPSIVGYNLTQTHSVKVRDTTKLEDLLTGVVSNGANSVSEVRFVIDDDDTSAKDQAREEAISDAKKKAKSIAKAAGFRIGKLVTLYETTNPLGYGMGGSDISAMKSEGVVAPAVEPGTVSTKVQVTLTYEVKD